MAKKKKPASSAPAAGNTDTAGANWLLRGVIGLLILAAIVAVVLASRSGPSPATGLVSNSPPAQSASAVTTTNAPPPVPPKMEINQAVMVTVELDFGGKATSIKEALTQVERRHEPENGRGRVFAVLDAYGEPTTDGKLHMSMHVSTEKPGMGSLVFKRTGEVLWKAQVVPLTNAPATGFSGQQLTILLANEQGGTVMLDGSKGPATVLDALVRDQNVPVRDFWPDGAEREVTFLYSACGCPVKVLVRRAGETTLRTKELPVIFPDDPSALVVINRLMGWPPE